MAGEFLFIMSLLVAIPAARIYWKRRRLPGERLGQWLMRTRRYDVESGYKDLMLCIFGLGLCFTAVVFHFRQELADLDTPAKALLGVLCVSFTLALPLLIWLTGKEGKKRLAEEDEQWCQIEEEANAERDGEDLDGR